MPFLKPCRDQAEGAELHTRKNTICLLLLLLKSELYLLVCSGVSFWCHLIYTFSIAMIILFLNGVVCRVLDLAIRIATKRWRCHSEEDNKINRRFGPNSFDSLAHRRTVAALPLYYRYYHDVVLIRLNQ